MNLIKHNLELIALILNIKLFLDSKQSNLNIEHPFVGIYKVLREIWLFEDELKTRIFGKLQIFEGKISRLKLMFKRLYLSQYLMDSNK